MEMQGLCSTFFFLKCLSNFPPLILCSSVRPDAKGAICLCVCVHYGKDGDYIESWRRKTEEAKEREGKTNHAYKHEHFTMLSFAVFHFSYQSARRGKSGKKMNISTPLVSL